MLKAIEVGSLTKEFGDFKAVDNISFQVEEGEIFGFLGPNGAGKSTTMMILTTLLKPTSGSVFVGGYDVMLNAKRVREKIGYVQQEISVDEFLTGRENLYLHARINQIPSNLIKSRIDDVLELVELGEKKDQATLTYSGGMRKRLDIANGLLSRPSVLFLDEPTVGLDIQTRRKIWGYIKKIRKDFGMTVFISTHYMEEADKLCDRIGIIDHGKIQVIDTPKSMKTAIGNEIISFNLVDGKANQDTLIEKINKIEFVKEVKNKQDLITVFSTKSNEVIPKIFQESANLEMRIRSLTLKQPTLDDVFISYTGRDLRDETENKKYSRRKEFNLNRRKGL
jgi:ABC-2 type transport system ATP-binding protein